MSSVGSHGSCFDVLCACRRVSSRPILFARPGLDRRIWRHFSHFESAQTEPVPRILPTLAAPVRSELVGIDHVGFASDYIPDVTWTADSIQLPMGQVLFPDGGHSAAMGAKGLPTPAPSQIIAALLDTMLEHGYTEEDCAKFIGGNAYRVFQQVWK